MNYTYDFLQGGNWVNTPMSSNIFGFKYLKESQSLLVQFKGAAGPGQVYRYDQVPEQLAVNFFNSQSKGKFFLQHIRNAFAGRKCDITGQVFAEKKVL
jgi:hypothetical protein